ncbi:MAG: D-alanine--D-alanine ligase [Sebaldella sp.]|nr:D-alanine--D-alanine ligase [Sebaldella sp.]
MKKLKVGVIRGGISSEREVSLKSGEEIIKELNKEKYDVKDIILNDKKDIFTVLEGLEFVFLGLHGKFGEDGKVQAILETMDIPYTGCGMLSSALCMDKDITKHIIKNYDIRTAKWFTVRTGEDYSYEEIIEKLGEKIIAKPNSGGSSVGVHFVNNKNELDEALEDIFKIDNEAIIEEVIEGVEISVPIIDGLVYPTLCIEPKAGTYFDYASKYELGGADEYVIEFEENLQNEINEFTKKAFYAVKCEGYARIDFMLKDNKAYLMEINTLPGMTATSLVPKSLKHLGVSYSELLDKLIEVSLKIKR